MIVAKAMTTIEAILVASNGKCIDSFFRGTKDLLGCEKLNSKI